MVDVYVKFQSPDEDSLSPDKEPAGVMRPRPSKGFSPLTRILSLQTRRFSHDTST